MAMYTRSEDGFAPIPAEHEAVLDMYREQLHTMVVWEPQYIGAYPFNALVDDADPYGSPLPSQLEHLAAQTANRLKRARRGEDDFGPDFEGLALAAVRALLAHEYAFTGSLHEDFSDDCGQGCHALAEGDVKAAAGELKQTITRMARDVIRDQRAQRGTAHADRESV
ncbi:hypothetical protein ACFU98_47910 [Streptomyces sp. NPDC057575]|uniref:hypothetical protein n=1 Tax=unclassified Streptomyces TaxID=2593676 RepID=UPI003688FF6A